MSHSFGRRAAAALLVSTFTFAAVGYAQTQPSQANTPETGAANTAKKPETHITPEQAKELFASVEQIFHFDSEDTDLSIKHDVKRKLTTRDAVEKYLDDKLRDDKDAKRMQRSEIVLKKFGLLDRDFQLGPFLVSLLKEQIAGYYDTKTKTVYLLDWIDPQDQKPVMAHELTHALQDQHVDLDKWEDQTSDDLSHYVAEDNHHIQTDEEDTAREAVAEGQAQVCFFDYALAPSGASIAQNPDYVLGKVDELSEDSSDSPVMNKAPQVLKESLLFPYTDGLKFEIALVRDKGKEGAFEGALNHPPSSSYEIMNPRVYEAGVKVPVLTMPDVHPLLDAAYSPYDVGVMGELDARMLLELTTSKDAADVLASQWDGGIYYAVQKKSAPDKASTASVALLYLSQWKTPGAAALFAKNYEEELTKKYRRAELQQQADAGEGELVYSTEEGPVVITTSGRDVFVSESFDLPTARKLELLMLGAQKGAAGETSAQAQPFNYPELTGSLRSFMDKSGTLRIETSAVLKSLARP